MYEYLPECGSAALRSRALGWRAPLLSLAFISVVERVCVATFVVTRGSILEYLLRAMDMSQNRPKNSGKLMDFGTYILPGVGTCARGFPEEGLIVPPLDLYFGERVSSLGASCSVAARRAADCASRCCWFCSAAFFAAAFPAAANASSHSDTFILGSITTRDRVA